jgi:O-antigen/teichoic acid export membrane protein
MVVSAGLLVQSWEVIDLFFQARSEAKVSAWVRMAACLLGSVVKMGLLLAEAPLVAFAVAGVLETAFAAMGWVGMAWRRGCGPKRWVVEWFRAKSLLQEGWPIALSGLAIYAQAYVDQLVIGAILGGEQLGQYAAAIRLVTVFAFIPTVVMTVAAPEITRAKRDDERLYLRRLHNLYRLMFLLFVAVALPLGILGPLMVVLLYGAPYAGAAALLPWLSLRLLLTNLGMARGVFVTNEGTFRFALLTGILGAFTNLGLNLLLVPAWGSLGAVAASLVSFSITIFAFEAFHPRMRLNLFIMAKAVLLPWRRFSA